LDFEASIREAGLEKCGQELVSSEPAWSISHSTDYGINPYIKIMLHPFLMGERVE